MINFDDRILSDLNECEMFLIFHIVKRMRATRMTSWPSLDTLSKECKWDERTVKKWRGSLMKKGFLVVQQKPGKAPVYSLNKTGIGIWHGVDNNKMEEMMGVQKMRGVQKMPLHILLMRGYKKCPPN